MGPPSTELRSSLLTNVKYVYRRGFSPDIEPRRVPALAELAKALSPKSKSHGVAVGVVLGWAVDRASHPLVHVFRRATSRSAVSAGLSHLLGLNNATPELIKERAKYAGPLLGYQNGYEGLKGGEHGHKKVLNLAFSEIADQLVLMAQEQGFTYRKLFAVTQRAVEGRDTANNDPLSVSPKALPPAMPNFTEEIKPIAGGRTDSLKRSYLDDDKQMVALRGSSPWKGDPDVLRQLLRRDVLKLYTKGFSWAASHHEFIPTLVALAQGRFGIGADLLNAQFPDWYLYEDRLNLAGRGQPFSDELADFLHWSIDQLDDECIIKGLVALLGLGATGGPTLADRRNHAAPYFEAQDGVALSQSGKELGLIGRLVHVMWVAALDIGMITLPPPST